MPGIAQWGEPIGFRLPRPSYRGFLGIDDFGAGADVQQPAPRRVDRAVRSAQFVGEVLMNPRLAALDDVDDLARKGIAIEAGRHDIADIVLVLLQPLAERLVRNDPAPALAE